MLNKYFSWYEDETWEQAYSFHSLGYTTIEEAVEDSIINDPSVPFVIIQGFRPVYVGLGCKESFLQKTGAK